MQAQRSEELNESRTPTQGPPVGSAYEDAQRRGQAVLRTAVLDAASALLVAEGAGALTMRRVASEVGCSTTVLYTLFGAKDGLAEALYREGFERLRRRLASVPRGPDPLADLAAMGQAYRASAFEERNYYGVMFEQAIPGFAPSPAAVAHAFTSLQFLVDAVSACVDSGAFVPGDPLAMAEAIWAASHGAVSLELAGHFADTATAAERYWTVTAAVVAWFQPSSKNR